MSKSITILLLFFLSIPLFSFAQHSEVQSAEEVNEKKPPFRIAALIGHTRIPDEHAGENFFIPFWGLDVEYWPHNQWGIGFHSDLELETFVILRDNTEEEELERISPLVITLDALYKPWKGLVVQLGPGIEFEQSKNFALLRLGIEYEFELNHHWDIAPTVFYDTRFNEYHTWSIGLGVGKRF